MTPYSRITGNVAGLLQGIGIANAFGAQHKFQLYMGIGFMVIGTILYLSPLGETT
ncbi:hypothetical protein [[Leptolyngbya] sp. PCC 7376]|uniref:hypothetical protein n=1 Tax=[Leptolyngbya] sp. PCC 7376 TaxID=111781 RepID=UPI0002F7842C|nr:hypothetical protein [[Leptolyngbya] sp. PCC 7376]